MTLHGTLTIGYVDYELCRELIDRSSVHGGYNDAARRGLGSSHGLAILSITRLV